MPTIDTTPPLAEYRVGAGCRAVAVEQTAAQRLDVALLPLVRPGTPVRSDPGGAARSLDMARAAALFRRQMRPFYRLGAVGTAVIEEHL